MSDVCPSVLQACAMRVARLDTAGVPRPGAKNLYVTDGMIDFSFTEELEKGDDVTVKNACGNICATYKGPDLLKRVTLQMNVCPYDPELFEMLRGGAVLSNGAAEGYQAPKIGVDPNPEGVSIELWARRYINGAPDPTWNYEWFAFPRTYWAFGQRKLENGYMISVLDGYGTENANWFNGPGNDWPVASDACYQSIPTNTIPTAHCGYETLVAS